MPPGIQWVADPNADTIYRNHPGQMSTDRVRMHGGTLAVLENTLGWIASERARAFKVYQKQNVPSS